MKGANSPVEIKSVKQWNESLRSATATGMTVVVDFHAEWCQPCKMIAPRYNALASDYPQAVFLRVDVDEQKAIAAKYQITAMPTFLAIKYGKVVDMLRGADPYGLAKLIGQHSGPNPPVPPLPEAAEAEKSAGNDLYREGKYAEAIEKYGAAIAIAPTSAALYSNRSIAYLKLEPPNHDLALADAQKATEVEPKWGKGYVRLGEALQSLEKNEEAVKAFEQAVELSQGLAQTEAKKKLQGVKQQLGWH
ncbi:Thioredoxin h [Mycena indigotica]|uniref:Thioredoxin h n=1 Tax=Mycena indigotica TaxID=2126181 RepID=A0A8H6TG98_9AGAR|nr:Thioredoxin h [Mycena indigotica]KAF7315205.1 Thioredoxin h [Mycena indigotica]